MFVDNTMRFVQTFSTLYLLIEDLNPELKDFIENDRRSEWLSKVYMYRPVVENVLRLETENPALFGTHCPQTIRRAK